MTRYTPGHRHVHFKDGILPGPLFIVNTYLFPGEFDLQTIVVVINSYKVRLYARKYALHSGSEGSSALIPLGGIRFILSIDQKAFCCASERYAFDSGSTAAK